MHQLQNFTICIAGVSIRFQFPSEVCVLKEFEEFLIEDEKEADVVYEIRLLGKPLQLSGVPVSSHMGIQVYQTKEGILRDYISLTSENGCQVACLLRNNQKHILYYPAIKWDYYSQDLNLLYLLGIEEVLIKHQALLLHSSVVKIGEDIVLFSGPSGIGKSTQAGLWENFLGANVINGDRCVIRKKENAFWGSGSPWSGTSGIYSKEQAPIKGIFILKQAPANSVRRLGTEAFKALYSQCIVNTWNRGFMEQITELLTGLLEAVPVYELACRPDQKAVELAYHTLFEGGIPDGRENKCTD